MERSLFVTKTKHQNLPAECLIMVREFYSDFRWNLVQDMSESHMAVGIGLNHFYVVLPEGDRIESRLDLEVGDYRRLLKRELYRILADNTGKALPWGILQGIRPTKLVFKIARELRLQRNNDAFTLKQLSGDITHVLMDRYLLSSEMAKMAVDVALNEERYMPSDWMDSVGSFSVYIGIPFCPTRCHYCSFTSYALDELDKLADEYLDCLLNEMEAVLPEMLKVKRISTVYIGGGTPTTLNERQLVRLLTKIKELLPMDQVEEFTVEAGRPDTITYDKLKILKDQGVDRISVNPQTMHRKTLHHIGRKHSVEQVDSGYETAVRAGFDRINMDLIIGLPGETVEDVEYTLSRIAELCPSEVTVHTLAVKRSSKIHEHQDDYKMASDDEIKRMLQMTRHYLMEQGDYKPYYLYRQKNMVASYENVGYFRSPEPCIYNIEIMEEVRNIVAFGAGSITKALRPDGRIERAENVKSLTSYMQRVEEMAGRKLELFGRG